LTAVSTYAALGEREAAEQVGMRSTGYDLDGGVRQAGYA